MSSSIENGLIHGILNWYPFKKGASIYFSSGCSEGIKNDLRRRGLLDSSACQYDYAVGYLLVETSPDPVAELKRIKALLKPDGHLFLVCENRLALKSFLGDYDRFTGKVFDGVEGYGQFTQTDREKLGGRCYSRSEILGFLDEAGLTGRQGYSVLPGLLMPQQMYRWDTVPRENIAIRYSPLYEHPSSVFLDEAKLYDSIIKNDMFHQMANAYMIDCSVGGEYYNAMSITVSMDRGENNATATIIMSDGKVIKKALYPGGNSRIDSLVANTNRLKSHGIKAVDLTRVIAGECDGSEIAGVVMDYIDAPTAQEYLRELIHKDRDEFIERMEEFLGLILSSSDQSRGVTSELGECYEDSYIDLVPLNCFFKDGEFVFFDQELSVKNYPVSVVMARALDIVYMGDGRMNSIVPENYFFEKYGFSKKINAIRAEGHKFINKLRNKSELTDFRKEHWVDYNIMSENRHRMNFSEEEYESLYLRPLDNTKGKKIYLFGSGNWGREFLAAFGNRVNIEAFLDNNFDGKERIVEGIRVTSPDEIRSVGADNVKVIVCIKNYSSVVDQLKKMGVSNYCLYNPGIRIAEENMGYVEEDDSWKHEIFSSNDSDVQEKHDGEVKAPDVKVGYVAGVFDLFHVGHLNILKRARENCDFLLVGVVSDAQAASNKTHSPYINEKDRLEIVAACRYVDKAFLLPPDAAGTRDVHRKYHFDVQFSGSDYENDERWLKEKEWLNSRGADLIFFPYTDSISSTKIKEEMKR